MKASTISELLRHGGFLCLNKRLKDKLGVERAFMLSNLMENFSYYNELKQLVEDRFEMEKYLADRVKQEQKWKQKHEKDDPPPPISPFSIEEEQRKKEKELAEYYEDYPEIELGFYYTESKRLKDTRWSPFIQNEIIDSLQDLALLRTKRKGLPARQYFFLNWLLIEKFIDSDENDETWLQSKDNSLNRLITRYKAIWGLGVKPLEKNINKTILNKTIPNKIKETLSKDNERVFGENPIQTNLPPSPGESRQAPSPQKRIPPEQAHSSNRRAKTPGPKKEHIPQTGWKREAVDAWNSIPQVSKHTDMTTGIMANVSSTLDDLAQGRFFDRREWDPDFLKHNRIPDDWTRPGENPKVMEAQIVRTVRKYACYWKEGCWPPDKKNLPRSLSDFLYNPRSQKSWFLIVVQNGEAKPIGKKNGNGFKDYIEVYVGEFKGYGILPDDEAAMKEIRIGLSAIEKRVLSGEFFSDSDLRRTDSKRQPGGLANLFHLYAEFLTREWVDYDGAFNPYGRQFKEFIQDVEE